MYGVYLTEACFFPTGVHQYTMYQQLCIPPLENTKLITYCRNYDIITETSDHNKMLSYRSIRVALIKRTDDSINKNMEKLTPVCTAGENTELCYSVRK